MEEDEVEFGADGGHRRPTRGIARHTTLDQRSEAEQGRPVIRADHGETDDGMAEWVLELRVLDEVELWGAHARVESATDLHLRLQVRVWRLNGSERGGRVSGCSMEERRRAWCPGVKRKQRMQPKE